MVIQSLDDIDKIFNTLQLILPIVFDNQVSFAIADRELFVKTYDSPSLPINTPKGTPLSKGGAAYEALQLNKIITKEIPKEVYGIPFQSYAIPIQDTYDQVIIIILIGKSLEKKVAVQDMAQHMTFSIKAAYHELENLTNSMLGLLNMNDSIANKMNQATKYTEDTNSIIRFINNISSQMNLLGMNAAIEAARCGDAGRGFAIIAKEIQTLSQSTKESLGNIEDVLKNISLSVNTVTKDINNIKDIYEQQSSAFQNIESSIAGLDSTAQLLEDLAQNV